jgi:hypothetical protein
MEKALMATVTYERDRLHFRLRHFERLISELIEHLGNGHGLRGAAQVEASEMLRELLEELRHESSQHKGSARHRTAAEILFASEIHRALDTITVKASSVPDERWINQLVSAQSDIRHTMAQV